MRRISRAEVFNPNEVAILKHLAANFRIDLLSFAILSKAFQTGTGRNGLVPDEDSLGPQLATLMQLCEAARIDEPMPVFRHREAMAKGNKEGIRPSDHQRAIAQLEI